MKADARVVMGAAVLVAVAVALMIALRATLLVAPEAVFPLIVTVVLGGAFLAAWIGRRRG